VKKEEGLYCFDFRLWGPWDMSLFILLFIFFILLFFLMFMFFQGKSDGSIDLLKSLYELLASARVGDKFSPHLQLLLSRLSDDVFSFLSSYLVSAGKTMKQMTPVVVRKCHDTYECVSFLTMFGRSFTSLSRTLHLVRFIYGVEFSVCCEP